MTEVELKFQVPADRLNELREAVEGLSPTRTRLQAAYHDTADGALARHGISLRLRQEGEAWVQTLKVGGASSVTRLEDNVPLVVTDGQVPTLDPERHAGSDAHIELRKALGKRFSLAEVFRTDVERLAVLFESNGATVELALDVGRFVAGDVSHPVNEMEFELKSGRVGDVFDAALPWVHDFALNLDVKAKSVRGRLLAEGVAHPKPDHARFPKSVSSEPRTFVQAAVASCLDQILGNASEVSRGSENPDHVHQLRVGLRRLRTALRELPELNAQLDPTWEAVLADTFRQLGKLRDAEILTSDTAASLAAAGAPSAALMAVDGPSASAAAWVNAPELQRTFLALLRFTMEAPGPDSVAFDGDAVGAVASRLDKLHRQVRKAAKRFLEMPADDQHAVRKRLKRLRYLAEFLAPAFPKTRVAATFKALKPAQDALGEHNDEATALAHFRDAAQADPKALFAVGWLTARQEVSARTAAKALGKAVRVKPFWAGKRA